jgi:hypothetical protein
VASMGIAAFWDKVRTAFIMKVTSEVVHLLLPDEGGSKHTHHLDDGGIYRL